ncbi:MAG: hypothetical protein ACI8PZ_005903 [Myxococcota bacterium]|jgi:hypothetical protein
MDVLQATLRLYREAAGEALAATRQSAIAIGLLALLFAVFTAADQVLGLADPGDSLGSQLVRGVVHAAGVGWYLALIEIPIAVRRPVRLADLQTSLGRYWREVLMVGFLFWMGELALRPLAGPSFPALVAIAAIIFNPAPELIYQSRSSSLELLGDAARFMQSNWPEWLGLHLMAFVGLSLWCLLAFGSWSAEFGLFAVQMFGPWFGFVLAGAYAWGALGPTPLGVASALGLLAFVHWFMLVRGHVYRRLSSSTRRGRVWQARM